MDPAYLQFFIDNSDQFEEQQLEVFEFAKGLSAGLNYEITTEQALLVNSIVDFSSFCTSIVAVNQTKVTHVRNLDFDFPADM